jgi:hypothetical protein
MEADKEEVRLSSSAESTEGEFRAEIDGKKVCFVLSSLSVGIVGGICNRNVFSDVGTSFDRTIRKYQY